MAKKRRARAVPLTIREAQREASAIASTYDQFECDSCAVAIARALGPKFPATFERLRTSDDSDVIALALEDVQVSTNRVDVGVRVGDKVFDNVHPHGVPQAEWAGRFISLTGKPLVHNTRSIYGFFGVRFSRREFVQWFAGS